MLYIWCIQTHFAKALYRSLFIIIELVGSLIFSRLKFIDRIVGKWRTRFAQMMSFAWPSDSVRHDARENGMICTHSVNVERLVLLTSRESSSKSPVTTYLPPSRARHCVLRRASSGIGPADSAATFSMESSIPRRGEILGVERSYRNGATRPLIND